MTTKPLVSVLITAYNAENLLSIAVKHLTEQTYRNIEIVVVEDGSKDRTSAIIKDLAAFDSRIKPFFPGRLGRAKALNFGLSKCQGEFVAVNDADDFSMPERFGLVYVGSDGERHTPVMLHRACYGSLERFLGIIIEHYAGAFPLWLAPVQVVVLPISEKYHSYAKEVLEKLEEKGLRAHLNAKDDRIGYKIRETSMQKIPYAIIVGEKEMSQGTVNVRSRDKGELGELSIENFFSQLEQWQK